MIQSATVAAFQLLLLRDRPSLTYTEIIRGSGSTVLLATGHHPILHESVAGSDESGTIMVFHKNFNLPWIAVSCLALWFLFVHTPPFWMQRQLLTRDTMLAAHIVAAGTIFLSCVHNTLFTPSFTVFGKPSLFLHTWVGRVGMVAGLISFPLGAFMAWSRLGKAGVGGTNLGFSIPITIGGFAQVVTQYFGYRAIRKYKKIKNEIAMRSINLAVASKEEKSKLDNEIEQLHVEKDRALRFHIGNMIGLFASACGIPAGMRLAEVVTGSKDGVATLVTILAFIGALTMIGSRYTAIMMPPPFGSLENNSNVQYGSLGQDYR